MNSTEDPATEIQMNRLRQFGYTASESLTRADAARLLHDFETHPEVRAEVPTDAFHFHKAVDNLRVASTQAATAAEETSCRTNLEAARVKRREFWIDTCREPAHMQTRSNQVLECYMKYGCRFTTPSSGQVQEVLNALDSAMPTWDCEHVDLFYQALQLNFPELVRS
jgi:hypothetical protein